MKKLYTDPQAEIFALHTGDIVTSSGSTLIELDDIARDTFSGAADGYERVS